MAQIFLRIGHKKELCINTDELSLKDVLNHHIDICSANFYIISSGHNIELDQPLENGASYYVVPRVLGGKGGFGSMLRAIGAQIDKTKSREACRDLSGRRMRDVNNEKKLREWVSKRANREREKEEKRRARIERLKAGPKHTFDDPDYMEQKTQVADRLEEALELGLKKAMNRKPEIGTKRKADEVSGSSAKRNAAEWLGLEGMEDFSDSSDSSDDMTEEEQLALASAISKYEQQLREENQDSNSSASDACGINEEGGTDDVAESSHVLQSQIHVDRASSEGDSSSKKSPSNEPAEVDSRRAMDAEISSGGQNADVDVAKSPTEKPNSTEKGGDHAAQKSGKGETGTEVPIALDEYESATELESLGLETLKAALMERGLKCGGTLQERAGRLFSVKGLSPEEIDPVLLAKGKGKGGKGKKSK